MVDIFLVPNTQKILNGYYIGKLKKTKFLFFSTKLFSLDS